MASGFEKYPRGGADSWDNGLGGELLTVEFFSAPSITGQIKVWLSAWVAKPVKWWNGTGWVTKPIKYWNGTSWIETGY